MKIKVGISNRHIHLTEEDYKSMEDILEDIYYLDKKDITLAVSSYDKICNTFSKKNMNKMIKNEMQDNLSYMIYNYTHTINDFLNNETSKLEIFNTHMKLKTNSCYSSFFKSLDKMPYIFIVDFNNMDYFYLQSISNKFYSR